MNVKFQNAIDAGLWVTPNYPKEDDGIEIKAGTPETNEPTFCSCSTAQVVHGGCKCGWFQVEQKRKKEGTNYDD
jgi:hypothetical protein